MTELNKKDIFEAIKFGHAWHAERIKEELVKLIVNSSYSHLEFDWDDDDNFYYLYEKECNLFVENGFIELRCDRDDFANPFKVFKHPVNAVTDIQPIFEEFISLIVGE